jgi:hypothetical protein
MQHMSNDLRYDANVTCISMSFEGLGADSTGFMVSS